MKKWDSAPAGCRRIRKRFLAVDMGCVGDDLQGDEHKVSICAKDASVPYDYGMTSRLVQVAKERGIDYVIDVFPHYGSDAGAALKGGNDVRGRADRTGGARFSRNGTDPHPGHLADSAADRRLHRILTTFSRP